MSRQIATLTGALALTGRNMEPAAGRRTVARLHG
ncbi:hypothetical protein J2S98_002280 [Arthrobacter oryzae]|nr:hypothetical protein [Arthrobacter oryzae]